jgi:hypothetical protein
MLTKSKLTICFSGTKIYVSFAMTSRRKFVHLISSPSFKFKSFVVSISEQLRIDYFMQIQNRDKVGKPSRTDFISPTGIDETKNLSVILIRLRFVTFGIAPVNEFQNLGSIL